MADPAGFVGLQTPFAFVEQLLVGRVGLSPADAACPALLRRPLCAVVVSGHILWFCSSTGCILCLRSAGRVPRARKGRRPSTSPRAHPLAGTILKLIFVVEVVASHLRGPLIVWWLGLEADGQDVDSSCPAVLGPGIRVPGLANLGVVCNIDSLLLAVL